MSSFFEQDHILHLSDQKIDNEQTQQSKQSKQQFKLPKLNRPNSRNKAVSRKQNKAPTYLPSIKNYDEIHQTTSNIQPNNLHENTEKQENINFRNTQMIKISQTQNQNDSFNQFKDDFAIDVESKLKLILGGENSKKIPDGEISDDDDFQQKINQNKEIIKMHKQKNQKIQKNQKKIVEPIIKFNEPSERLLMKFKPKPNSTNNNSKQPLSNYEKKMKQYNYNNSLQNKYLQRKKQSLGIIIEKPPKPMQRAKSKKILSMKEALDDAKINFGYNQFKSNAQINNNQNIQNNKPSVFSHNVNAIKGSIQKNQRHPKNQNNDKKQRVKTRKTQESLSPNRKGSLFDNIQTFLENPTAAEKHEKFYKQIAKRLKNKDMNKLEEQIKQITEKIATSDTNIDTAAAQAQPNELKIKSNNQIQSHSNEQTTGKQFLLIENPMQRTVRDWKRVQIKDKKHFNYNVSNFDKELDYINYLQEKNSNSLSRFIDHQKIMVQLQLNKRFSKSIGKDDLIEKLQ